MGSTHQLEVTVGGKEQKEKEGGSCPAASQEAGAHRRMSFSVSANHEDEEDDRNYSYQVFSSINSVLGIRTQLNTLLSLDALSADRVVSSQLQVEHASHSSLCVFMAGSGCRVFT